MEKMMKKSLKQRGIAVFLVLLIGMALAVGAVSAEEKIEEPRIGEEIAVPNPEINMPGVNKYVKLEPDLYDRLQQIDDEEKIKVGIWLTAIDSDAIEKTIIAKYPDLKLMRTKPALDADIDVDMEVYEKFYGELTEAKKEAYAAIEKPLLDQLKARGFEITYASRYAPLVFTVLPKDEIMALQEREDVVAIYLSRTYEPEIDTAVPTIRAPAVWNRGYNGTGIKVAVVEADSFRPHPLRGDWISGRVEFGNPFLSESNGGAYRPTGPVGYHPTLVTGVIASDNDTYKGVAYGTTILSANAVSFDANDLVNASDWALDNGADVLSLSFGQDTDLQLTELDRYYDHVIWEHFRAVVKSAGNRAAGIGCPHVDGNVTSPGLGWNVITVGGTDDNDTADWSDDTRYACSSYKNPISPHGDRNKPEVSAVAARIQSTENESYYNSTGSWITLSQHKVSGTSFAAPAVAGEIALLINRDSRLRNWPEVTKAVVMATALHNTYGDRIDDGEGVGTVEASLADMAVNNGWIRGYNITQADLPMNRSRDFTEGTTVRAVICWDSHTDWHVNKSKDTLAADLNLEVYHPDGTKITGSYSYDNNYEVVEFVAPVNGTYTGRITYRRFDEPFEYVGWAWSEG